MYVRILKIRRTFKYRNKNLYQDMLYTQYVSQSIYVCISYVHEFDDFESYKL